MPSRLSCRSGEQPVPSREGSCLAGTTGSGPREGTGEAREFSDVGLVCLMPPPELVLNLSFLYLTLGKLSSADTVRHKITPNMGILLGDRSSLERSL